MANEGKYNTGKIQWSNLLRFKHRK